MPILSSVECRERIRRVLNREGLHDDEDVEIEGSKEEKEGNTRWEFYAHIWWYE